MVRARALLLGVSLCSGLPLAMRAEEPPGAEVPSTETPAAEAAAEPAAETPPPVTIGDRRERLRLVPAAVTMLDADLLERANVDSRYDVELLTPALVVHDGFAYLRAAGEGGDASAPMLVNGQPLSAGIDSSFSYYDVEQVALLRGSTLIGAGNGGEGALDVTWKAPHAGRELFGDATTGSDQWWRFRAGANVAPLGEGDERLSARAALQGEWRGGDSPSSGRALDDLGARLSLRSVPRAGTELVLRTQILHGGAEPAPVVLGNVRGFDGELRQAAGELRGLGAVAVLLRGGWQESEIDALLPAPTPSGFAREEFTHEHSTGDLRVETRDGRFADAALGFFYERGSDETGVLETHAPYLSLSLRPFASVGVPLLDLLDFFGGARWNDESFAERGGPFRLDRDEWVWELGARFRPRAAHLLWVRYGDEGFVPQHAWELGWKSHWWAGRVDASAVLFRASSRRFRESCLIPSPGGCLLEIDGPDGTRRWGFELEASARPREGLRLGASLARLEGDYDVLGAFVATPLSNAPEWKLTVLAAQRFSLGERGALTPLAAFVWIDENDRTLGGPVRETRRTDLRMRWDAPSDRYWVEGFAENLEDRSRGPAFDDPPRGRVLGVRVGFALAPSES